MTVNAHLNKVASAAVLTDTEKQAIRTSIGFITSNLTSYFGSEISEITIFGSFSRNTILPRYADERSDVDLMVVFKDSSFKPQTYLNRLKAFTSTYYKSSEIKQSHPTIRLELNHIMFELVPAVKSWGTYYIPDRAASWNNWLETDPTGFNQELTNRNTTNSSLAKPLVRVLKYWNAYNGYPFESYELEKKIVAHSPPLLHYYNHLGTYFYNCVGELAAPFWGWAQDKRTKLDRLKSIAISAKKNEDLGYTTTAVQEISKIIPLK